MTPPDSVTEAFFGYTCSDCGANCDHAHGRFLDADRNLVVLCLPCEAKNFPEPAS